MAVFLGFLCYHRVTNMQQTPKVSTKAPTAAAWELPQIWIKCGEFGKDEDTVGCEIRITS